MDLHELLATTPQLLRTCDTLVVDPPPPTPELGRYAAHPDIQFFRHIKSKHHYNYHRARKAGIESITARSARSDPFSRPDLLNRLRTFNALNWQVPVGVESEGGLNELLCARNGWKCMSILVGTSKNTLHCGDCHAQITLRFNERTEMAEESASFDDPIFLLDEYTEMDIGLAQQYRAQVCGRAHKATCSWRSFETPRDVYYGRAHLEATDAAVVDDFVAALSGLVANLAVAESMAGRVADRVRALPSDEAVKSHANTLLLARARGDDKENWSALLANVPHWVYKLAAYGWEINVQLFAETLVVLLVCSKCNQRVFVSDSHHHRPVEKNNAAAAVSVASVAPENVLTPCKYPPPAAGSRDIDLFSAEEEEDDFDIVADHKPWCCTVARYDDLPYYEYFVNLICGKTLQKRKNFDINEGLDRLNKLRKLYLTDEPTEPAS